ncbi:MAG: hypothetical protein A3G29_03465 [Burkholderiales bacterium RIFCSPLOWO2_12_FULL_64_99]|nr:MAG: hypothetical protein A3E52_11430 [Burkholderiales bacterium RIFCSPHIGHO2_12_FULL_63_20]OGB64540.1 MAG: hypothetical protein A3G29_03465 [Burkholderiales bacterium RIFCSPLOWO2_12_FULL_64_99]
MRPAVYIAYLVDWMLLDYVCQLAELFRSYVLRQLRRIPMERQQAQRLAGRQELQCWWWSRGSYGV